MDRKRIVIVGAGFGGIYTYQSLPRWVKASCDVTIIDRRNHFLFTPLLPEVAGASLVERVPEGAHRRVAAVGSAGAEAGNMDGGQGAGRRVRCQVFPQPLLLRRACLAAADL